jgi:hypothetical protein
VTHLEVDAASVHLLNSILSGGMISELNKAIVEATLVSKLSQIGKRSNGDVKKERRERKERGLG